MAAMTVTSFQRLVTKKNNKNKQSLNRWQKANDFRNQIFLCTGSLNKLEQSVV